MTKFFIVYFDQRCGASLPVGTHTTDGIEVRYFSDRKEAEERAKGYYHAQVCKA